jgi:hypothetical protein
MGISVAEYFAQKEACSHCAEHGNEEHCVTTLLSRKENCFVYSIIHDKVGEYTPEEVKMLRDMRNNLPDEENVEYYVRGEKLIEEMGLMDKPYYEQYSIFSKINYNHIRNVVSALTDNRTEDAKQLINNMLSVLEKEYNI